MTNNPSQFAELILKSLGIRDLFSRIIGMQEMNYIQKPDIGAFKILEPFLKNGKKIIFIDDELDNIKTAKEIGCTTIFIGDSHGRQKIQNYWLSQLL